MDVVNNTQELEKVKKMTIGHQDRFERIEEKLDNVLDAFSAYVKRHEEEKEKYHRRLTTLQRKVNGVEKHKKADLETQVTIFRNRPQPFCDSVVNSFLSIFAPNTYRRKVKEYFEYHPLPANTRIGKMEVSNKVRSVKKTATFTLFTDEHEEDLYNQEQEMKPIKELKLEDIPLDDNEIKEE